MKYSRIKYNCISYFKNTCRTIAYAVLVPFIMAGCSSIPDLPGKSIPEPIGPIPSSESTPSPQNVNGKCDNYGPDTWKKSLNRITDEVSREMERVSSSFDRSIKWTFLSYDRDTYKKPIARFEKYFLNCLSNELDQEKFIYTDAQGLQYIYNHFIESVDLYRDNKEIDALVKLYSETDIVLYISPDTENVRGDLELQLKLVTAHPVLAAG